MRQKRPVPRRGRNRVWAVFTALAIVWLAITTARAQSGNVIRNGSSTATDAEALAPGFLFEPEVPLASLKGVPIWHELEQLLDNPYATTATCNDSQGQVPANDQG